MIQIRFRGHASHYLVPQKTLESNSLLVRRGLNSTLRNAPEPGRKITIELPGGDGKAACFKYSVNWLVHGTIKTGGESKGANTDYREYLTLARLYLLGQWLEVSRFQDEALGVFAVKITADKAAHFFADKHVAQIIRCIYENTGGSEDRYRRLLVTIFACFAEQKDVARLKEGLPADFMADLAVKAIGMRPWR